MTKKTWWEQLEKEKSIEGSQFQYVSVHEPQASFLGAKDEQNVMAEECGGGKLIKTSQ